MSRTSPSAIEQALAGGGQMGALMRAFDWSRTPVGPIDAWPQSLRTAVSILLASGYPMYIAWGPEYVQFYNDAYRPILGSTKHPAALGQTAPECFPEIWEIIGPMFAGVMAAGEAVSVLDFLLPLDRYGYTEECYFDYSYSAVRDESGHVGGIFVTCSETTGRVIGERRLRTLRELGTSSSYGDGVDKALKDAAGTLGSNGHDLPFVLLYAVGQDGQTAQLAAAAGATRGSSLAPASVALDESDDSLWPVARVLNSRRAEEVELSPRLGRIVAGPWPEPVRTALVLPLIRPGALESGATAGVMVAGISPRRALDDDYRGFLELVAGQLSTTITNAEAYRSAVERAEALAEIDRAKTVFFNNISHEFRTPLTLSIGPLEELLDQRAAAGQDVATRQQLDMVHRNLLRLLRLVNSLLEFSRLEAGRAQAIYRPTDLARLTADLAGIFRAAVERAGVTLVVAVDPLPQPVYVDVQMWEKIVLNLLSNAFKFTFAGTITVTLQASTAGAVLAVSDTGVGIPPDEVDRVFDRFHRVRRTRARTFEGTGIGLALVKELVELQGGQVTVASEVGKGSSFTVTIPFGTDHLPSQGMVTDQATLTAPSADALGMVEEAYRWLPGADEPAVEMPLAEAPLAWSAPDAVVGARLLVVDDNQDMRRYLVRLLSPYFAVEAVADGLEALASAGASTPDLIITDVMMPGMDGFELLRALRSRDATAATPVIMLSARAGEEATVEGLEAGADDYLIKPFTSRELLARVRANLLMSRARSEASLSIARYQAALAAQERALAVLLAVARHLESSAELTAFFGELSDTVSDLVQARFALFWLLDERAGTLSVQRNVRGLSEEVVAAMGEVRCRPDGDTVAERIVFQGEDLGPAQLSEPRFDVYRERLNRLGAHDAIGTAWRVGDRPLGTLVAYDSQRPGGFTEEDLWVLKIAALAAGLVWQQKMAERELDEARRREEQGLKAQVARMTELERLKSQFLRLASHELRGPLTVLRGYLEMMESGSLGASAPSIQSIYPILSAKVQEMSQLVNRMLDTARLEDERLTLAFEDLDIRNLIRESVAAVAPPRSTHEIVLRLPADSVPVSGDRQRLGSVISNLVDNAMKYSPAGSIITVGCAVDAEQGIVTIDVEDRGIGIDASDLPRLFSRFSRIVNSDNSHIPGAGLGLYLSREIARMHGGDITITSTRHQGTSARLTLKLAPIAQEAIPR